MEIEKKILSILGSNGSITSLMIAEVLKLDHEVICEELRKMLENSKILLTELSSDWNLTEDGLVMMKEMFGDQMVDASDQPSGDKKTENNQEELASKLRKVYFGFEKSLKDVELWELSVSKLIKEFHRDFFRVDDLKGSEGNDKFGVEGNRFVFYYNISPKPIETGCLHLLTQMKLELRQYLAQLGFQEYQDLTITDVYLLNYNLMDGKCETVTRKSPNERSPVLDISSMGSNFSDESNKKTLLSNHLMGFLMQTLYSIDNQNPCQSFRYLTFGKVFFNRYLDSDECHLIEGAIVEKEFSFGDLLAIVLSVLGHFGLKTVVIKPLKVNHLKPNVNLLCYHEELDEWLQVGSCGMVHPKITKHIKVGQDFPAAAFIISLEAIIMIKCGIMTTKEIVGPLISLQNKPLLIN